MDVERVSEENVRTAKKKSLGPGRTKSLLARTKNHHSPFAGNFRASRHPRRLRKRPNVHPAIGKTKKGGAMFCSKDRFEEDLTAGLA